MGLSIRAYARHRGVTDTAVHKAIRAGRISPEQDGTIDPEKADRDWSRNSEPPRGGTRATAVKAAVPSEAATTGPADASQGKLPSGGASLMQLRTANEAVKLARGKIKVQKERDELVDRNQAIAHVFSMGRAERDAWLNWPSRVSAQMAAKLGLDPHTMHIALDAAVREHLLELGALRPRVD